jgi:hypothetical protein
MGKKLSTNEKKISPTQMKQGIYNFVFSVLYSGEIASTGQTSAQAPQSMHVSGSIT